MTLSYAEARNCLDALGQAHVLRFWDSLSAEQRGELLRQVSALDLPALERLRALCMNPAPTAAAEEMEPAPVVRLTPAERATAAAAGEALLREGRVGVLLVAGGQGSRLGFDGPKGCFPIGPLTHASLFAMHARKILAFERKYGVAIPLYIMTSEANDAATRAFFTINGNFGLQADRVRFFMQGLWPALDAQGRMLLDRPDHIFTSPDGHGGTLAALQRSGSLADMKSHGLTTIFYCQVDNPLVEIADPVFLGVHHARRSQVSVKVCAKSDPEEKLGVVVRRGGRDAVVEYSELTRDQQYACGADGELRYRFGSVAIHVFAVDFLAREAAASLPVHLAFKKVAFCDDRGALVEPKAPNAYKFEKFIFDVLPDAERVVHLEFAREEEFSPVKNPSGADSAVTTRRDLVRKFARWLECCGITVPRNADGEPRYRIEIDPCFARSADELKARLPQGLVIKEDLVLA